MFKYSINLAWSEEDSCYVATVAEFPGLSAFGESPEEAIEEAKIAVEGFLKVYQEDGCPIPKPATIKSFSGQTRLRLPKSLHGTLNQEAQKEGVSLNTYLVSLLSERHVSKQLEKELLDLKNIVLMNVLPTGEQSVKAKSDVHTLRLQLIQDGLNYQSTLKY
ncbi:MAG: type II toxin-antitoxin system HicB family antitoxin [Desulfobulbaceae bacterium]|nr:type II toxin-antitoxin system HicB family antitoxin [Desulfobulbaceae bacterium]